MISQIPNVIYAVSVGRTRMFRTPLGTVSIHHVQPEFFFGFEVLDTLDTHCRRYRRHGRQVIPLQAPE